jgi:hypothetical protein
MYFPRLLILPLLVSVCFAAQVPGHLRPLGNAYECVGPETVQSPWKNPLSRPALGQDGVSLENIVPPPEFRARDLKMVDARGVSLFDGLFRAPRKPISCQGTVGDGRASYH